MSKLAQKLRDTYPLLGKSLIRRFNADCKHVGTIAMFVEKSV